MVGDYTDGQYYWNTVNIIVTGDFGQASIVCKNHENMGQDLLKYGECNEDEEDEEDLDGLLGEMEDEEDEEDLDGLLGEMEKFEAIDLGVLIDAEMSFSQDLSNWKPGMDSNMESVYYDTFDGQKIQREDGSTTGCGGGFFEEIVGMDEVICTKCEAGKYSKPNQWWCDEADYDYFVSAEGSFEQTPCPAGQDTRFQMNKVTSSLEPCEPENQVQKYENGTVKTDENGIEIDICVKRRGSTSCNPIICNRYMSNDDANMRLVGSECACFEGYASEANHKNYGPCSQCLEGTYVTNIDPGDDETGTPRIVTQTRCENAQAGYYIDDVGALSQTECPAGKYQNLIGKNTCKVCPNGWTSGTAAKECVPCPVGKYGKDGMCVQCSQGKFNAHIRNIHCETCPTGSTSRDIDNIIVSVGASKCQRCEYPTYDDDKNVSTECVECISGYEIHRDFPQRINGEDMYRNSNGDLKSCLKSHWKPDRCADVQYDQEDNYLFDWVPDELRGINDQVSCEEAAIKDENEDGIPDLNYNVEFRQAECPDKYGGADATEESCVENKCRIINEGDSGGRYCTEKISDSWCGVGTKLEGNRCVVSSNDGTNCEIIKNAFEGCNKCYTISEENKNGYYCGVGTRQTYDNKCVADSNNINQEDCQALKKIYTNECEC